MLILIDSIMFWNVYYVKGAFLNADAAFEVIQGIRTLTVRMLAKCINTQILAQFLDSHPQIRVNCNGLPGNENAERISSLVANDVRFVGCLNTVESIERRTGKRPELIPVTIPVQTGVAQLVERAQQGFVVIRP